MIAPTLIAMKDEIDFFGLFTLKYSKKDVLDAYQSSLPTYIGKGGNKDIVASFIISGERVQYNRARLPLHRILQLMREEFTDKELQLLALRSYAVAEKHGLTKVFIEHTPFDCQPETVRQRHLLVGHPYATYDQEDDYVPW